MDANAARAAGLDQNTVNIDEGLPSLPSLPSIDETQGAGTFADLLGDVLQNAIDSNVRAEQLQVQALTGGGVELADLVTAISEAELTVNTVVAVRDRVISAYQEIARMPI